MYTDITKISNNYILKELFSYINYNYLLKLVKNNKKIQNKLGINIENYKNRANFPIYEYLITTKIIEYPEEGIDDDFEAFAKCFTYISVSIIAFLIFSYSFIYSILLVALDTFNDNNTKIGYKKSYLTIINRINYSLFILDGTIIFTAFFFMCYLFEDVIHDFGAKKYIKLTLLYIINLEHLLFEALIISKLALSYEIKKGGLTWFMKMDYAFIVFHFLYIIYVVYNSCSYCCASGDLIGSYKKCTLVSFNNIRIHDYKLPDDFPTFKKKERKAYVFNNHRQYKYDYTPDQMKIFDLINEFREENDIPKLNTDNSKTIPDFIIYPRTDMILLSNQHIIKINNKEYLFIFQKGEFNNKLINNDDEIKKILLKDLLNHIQIISVDGIEYIHIWEKLGNDFFDNTFPENEDNEYNGFLKDKRHEIKKTRKKYYSE